MDSKTSGTNGDTNCWMLARLTSSISEGTHLGPSLTLTLWIPSVSGSLTGVVDGRSHQPPSRTGGSVGQGSGRPRRDARYYHLCVTVLQRSCQVVWYGHRGHTSCHSNGAVVGWLPQPLPWPRTVLNGIRLCQAFGLFEIFDLRRTAAEGPLNRMWIAWVSSICLKGTRLSPSASGLRVAWSREAPQCAPCPAVGPTPRKSAKCVV